MSELPFRCLPHGRQSPLQPRSVVHRGPGLEQLHRGHRSCSTHWAFKSCQFTIYVETEGLYVCLVQMMALAVQPLEEQT